MSTVMDQVDDGEGKADLTPMIDMVFQLIIFFIVVSDFSSSQLEPLTLPIAIKADTDFKEKSTDRVIFVNVLPDGKIMIDRHIFGGPDPRNPGRDLPYKVLHDYIQIQADLAHMEENKESPGHQVSKLRVVIRADKDSRYKYVQQVFKACAENRVFKTVIHATKEKLKRVGGKLK